MVAGNPSLKGFIKQCTILSMFFGKEGQLMIREVIARF